MTAIGGGVATRVVCDIGVNPGVGGRDFQILGWGLGVSLSVEFSSRFG